jgi:hypothetical protein
MAPGRAETRPFACSRLVHLSTVTALSAHCVERGLYEVWAPAGEVAGAHEADFRYDV